MTPVEARTIRRAVGKVRRRLRLQTTVRWTLLLGAAAGVVVGVGIGLYQAWLLPPDAWVWFAGAAGALLFGGLMSGLLRRFDRVALAQRLDRANGLMDRLGTSLEILEKPAESWTEFEQAQVRDAMAFAKAAKHAPAAPWRFPVEVAYVLGAGALAWGLTYIKVDAPEGDGEALRAVYLADLPPLQLTGPAVIEPEEEEAEVIKEQIEKNEHDLAPLAEHDESSQKFIEQLNAALEKLAEGKLTDRELAKEAADLEEMLDELTAETPEEAKTAEEFEKELEQVAEALDKESAKIKEEELKDLAKLLEEKKYEEAAKKLEELLEKFAKMDKKEQEKIAKMFEKLAEKFKSELMKDMEKLAKDKSRLEKKDEKGPGGLDKKEQSRLDKLQKELDKLQRQYDQQTSQAKKQLDELSKAMKQQADRMKRPDEQQKAEQGEKPEDQQGADRKSRPDENAMKKMAEMLKKMGMKQQRGRLGQMGKMRMADLKEMMRRRQMGKGPGEGRKQLEKLARGQGKQPGDKDGEDEGEKSLKPGNGKPREGVEWQRVDTPHDGPLSQGPGEGTGEGGRMMHGKATDIAAKTLDDFVEGKKGPGPSKKEVLYGAAEKGTKVAGYGDAQIDYSMRAAKTMQNEEVPPGYREYVEEYFRLIRER